MGSINAEYRGVLLPQGAIGFGVYNGFYYEPGYTLGESTYNLMMISPGVQITYHLFQDYTLIVDGKINKDAAWYYPEPKSAAGHIANKVAFWKGVDVRHTS